MSGKLRHIFSVFCDLSFFDKKDTVFLVFASFWDWNISLLAYLTWS
jgi:hypothetical protein